MGRLIDADKIMDKMESTFDMQELYLPIHFKELIIDDMPSIEAIPKADYEARLKADLVSMLTEMQTEIEECVDGAEGSPQFEQGVTIARVQVVEIIQEKINTLKEKYDAVN